MEGGGEIGTVSGRCGKVKWKWKNKFRGRKGWEIRMSGRSGKGKW